MRKSRLERNLSTIQHRLAAARQDLDVLEEQLLIFDYDAEDSRVRALVSETPLDTHDHRIAKRHADASNRAKQKLLDLIADLEQRQDRLINQLVNASSSDLHLPPN